MTNYRLTAIFPNDDVLCYVSGDKKRTNAFYSRTAAKTPETLFLAEEVNDSGEVVKSREFSKEPCDWDDIKSCLVSKPSDDRYVLYKLEFNNLNLEHDPNRCKIGSRVVAEGLTIKEVMTQMAWSANEPGYGTEWTYLPLRM